MFLLLHLPSSWALLLLLHLASSPLALSLHGVLPVVLSLLLLPWCCC
jgi:hypothetical protein